MQLAITAARVLVGPAGHTLRPGGVLIDNDTITAVGSPSLMETLSRPGVTRLDYPDATVLPGLIDAHVHLAFDAGPDPLGALAGTGDADLLAAMAARARRLLDAGVTTVRDLGDRHYLAAELRDSIEAGLRVGPRVLTAGAPLTLPGGHCWSLGGEVETPEQVREIITRHVEHGVDWIKVMVSGGKTTRGARPMWEDQFSSEQLRLIVALATEAGLPVAAHTHSTTGIAAATREGVASIEHCTWFTGPEREATAKLDDTTARLIASNGIAVTPTIGANWRQLDAQIPGWAEHRTRVLRWQDQHGIRMMSGTDAGVSSAPFDHYPRHFELFTLAGFPASRILDMATRDTAAGLGLGRTIGTLGHGYSADLVVVTGDPLTDLSALNDPVLIVTRGRQHIPATGKEIHA